MATIQIQATNQQQTEDNWSNELRIAVESLIENVNRYKEIHEGM